LDNEMLQLFWYFKFVEHIQAVSPYEIIYFAIIYFKEDVNSL